MNFQGANLMPYNRYDQQSYMKKYYKEHREKIINQSIQWKKDNPEKVKIIVKRFRERREPENKTNYGRKGQKVLLIKQYGKDLESKKDNVTRVPLKRRLFCLDCEEHETDLCPGWENCEYKLEIIQLINDKKENVRNYKSRKEAKL
jgi:hypothetical protein